MVNLEHYSGCGPFSEGSGGKAPADAWKNTTTFSPFSHLVVMVALVPVTPPLVQETPPHYNVQPPQM